MTARAEMKARQFKNSQQQEAEHPSITIRKEATVIWFTSVQNAQRFKDVLNMSGIDIRSYMEDTLVHLHRPLSDKEFTMLHQATLDHS